MGNIELLIIALGLSMDAFAVAICKGLSMRMMNYKKALIVAVFFGGFQALMPLIGYFLGLQFKDYIVAIDHWIAFGLLLFIGIKMIREARKACPVFDDKFSLKDLTILAIATSIDALAIGITLAFLQVKIIPSVTMIGVITFILSFLGVKIGNVFGSKYQSKAEIIGGVILIGMGLRILLEHLGIL